VKVAAQEDVIVNPRRKNLIAYNRRTDGDSAAQRQLILDRHVDSRHTVCRRIRYDRLPARRSHPHTCNRPHSGQQNKSCPLLTDVSRNRTPVHRHHQPIGSPGDQLQRIRSECLSLMWSVFRSYHGDDRNDRHGHKPTELRGVSLLGISDLWRRFLAQRIWVFFTLSESHV